MRRGLSICSGRLGKPGDDLPDPDSDRNRGSLLAVSARYPYLGNEKCSIP
jgi:hypothetical protein